jgi:hypothetical protein
MKEEAAMARKFEVFDRFGNRIDADIVPDGGRVRVSMMARDSTSDGSVRWRRTHWLGGSGCATPLIFTNSVRGIAPMRLPTTLSGKHISTACAT